jgi:hypothetical protein
MRVLVELGRLLLADALRAAADSIDSRAAPVVALEEVEPGELVPPEAAAMVAAREPPALEEVEPEPPPVGSLEARGRKVGEKWAV